MKVTANIKLFSLGLLVATSLLGGCAGSGATYRPIVDGGDLTHYDADLTECQALAKNHGYMNADTQTDAAVGAMAGGFVGALESREDAIAGAIVGALFGAIDGSLQAHDDMREMVSTCMYYRGYRVIDSGH